ncbi:MAG: TlpA disulfide reductase family protein [Parabacteroides sp.]|nr:TlpA disulfide reductase family protein [Parabacteroides sp.]
MNKISKILTALFSLSLLLAGCQKEQKFKVEGVISDAEDMVLYLENIGISSVETLDSVKLNRTGKFHFSQLRPEYPDFYRLRLKNQLINFAVDSTETVMIEADANTFATSYKIEGSENNKAIKTITLAQLDANQAISKLKKEYNEKQIADTTMANQVDRIFNEYKNTALKYIYSAPMSTVAYYALFQQIDGMLLFDLYDKTDSRAYGAVATSYDHFYPESPRAAHLHNLALQSIKVIRSQRPINLDNLETTEISYMNVSLPDVNGNIVKLSDVARESVTIVNFTAYQAEWSPSLNMEFGRLYSEYSSKGLKIYQISLDADLHFWRNAASNLPWNSVRDPETVYSKVASLYNVKQLPAIFLLDKKGNLVKRVEDLRTLEKEIKGLL